MRKLALVSVSLGLAAAAAAVAASPARDALSSLLEHAPTLLQRCGILSLPAITESSGLVRSRTHPGVFWTHNDSGDTARIFAVRRDGSPIIPKGSKVYDGVRIFGAVNEDWEDIAADDAGNLIIGDVGNNNGNRRELALYVVPEPDPLAAATARGARRVPIVYPEQRNHPDARSFDAEAVFWARGKIYVLTKHRSGSQTTLYRLDSEDSVRPNVLTPVGVFDTQGPVTGADASPDGTKLAVLTYTSVWLFVVGEGSDDYFAGRVAWMPIFAKQCEAICFDGDTLLIGNEQRDLYEVGLDRFIPVK